MHDNQSALKKP